MISEPPHVMNTCLLPDYTDMTLPPHPAFLGTHHTPDEFTFNGYPESIISSFGSFHPLPSTSVLWLPKIYWWCLYNFADANTITTVMKKKLFTKQSSMTTWQPNVKITNATVWILCYLLSLLIIWEILISSFAVWGLPHNITIHSFHPSNLSSLFHHHHHLIFGMAVHSPFDRYIYQNRLFFTFFQGGMW